MSTEVFSVFIAQETAAYAELRMSYFSFGVLLRHCLLQNLAHSGQIAFAQDYVGQDCPEQNRRAQRSAAGFTLIEMLVVIIIVAILAAIALPAFLSQVRRAQQGEALTYIGAINRAQQAYRLDSISFANSIDSLGVGLADNTKFYQYTVLEGSSRIAHAAALPQDESLAGFSGVVYVVINPDGTAVTSSQVCQGTRGSAPALSFSLAGSSVAVSGCDDL